MQIVFCALKNAWLAAWNEKKMKMLRRPGIIERMERIACRFNVVGFGCFGKSVVATATSLGLSASLTSMWRMRTRSVANITVQNVLVCWESSRSFTATHCLSGLPNSTTYCKSRRQQLFFSLRHDTPTERACIRESHVQHHPS